MAYLVPAEFVTKMVDAGEAKIFMSTRDTVIRAFMAGAILALAAAFAVTVNVQTGYPIVGAMELVHKLMEQIKPFSPTFHLGQQVQEVGKLEDGRFRIVTSGATEFLARAVVIAGGVGAFQPVQLRLPGPVREPRSPARAAAASASGGASVKA